MADIINNDAVPSIERSLDKIVDELTGSVESYKEAVPSVERSLDKIATLYERGALLKGFHPKSIPVKDSDNYKVFYTIDNLNVPCAFINSWYKDPAASKYKFSISWYCGKYEGSSRGLLMASEEDYNHLGEEGLQIDNAPIKNIKSLNPNVCFNYLFNDTGNPNMTKYIRPYLKVNGVDYYGTTFKFDIDASGNLTVSPIWNESDSKEIIGAGYYVRRNLGSCIYAPNGTEEDFFLEPCKPLYSGISSEAEARYLLVDPEEFAVWGLSSVFFMGHDNYIVGDTLYFDTPL